MKKITLSLLPLFTLTACAPHLNQQQCANMNWYERGFNYGANGTPYNLGNDAEDCAKFKLSLDTKAYQKGFNDGLKQYCTYDRGYELGSKGQNTPGICENNPLLHKGYKEGLKKYCTYDNGYQIGSQGYGYPQACSYSTPLYRGYQAGSKYYCSNPDRGYEIGSQGNSYPEACDPITYPAFKNAYDRGSVIHNRVSELQGRIDAINNRINELVSKYQYHQKPDGTYRLSHRDTSAKAEAHLPEVNALVKQLNPLKEKAFKAEITSMN